MKHWRFFTVGLMGMAMSAVSSAITFSNISVFDDQGGVLVAGNSVNTGTTDIDFLFPNAFVGDPSVLRSGTMTMMFEADSGPNDAMTSVNLSILGAILGNNWIDGTETVEDLVNPGVIGFLPINTDQTPLPISEMINFSRASTHVKVTKVFKLNAPFSNDDDLVQISLVEQNFTTRPVPEPASLAALALGGVALISRRRRKS